MCLLGLILVEALLLLPALEGQLFHELADLRLVLRAELLQPRPVRHASLLLMSRMGFLERLLGLI